ncbi:MAG: DUF370 domain-containing protein [Firmicutes bacterium]|nr:DUF370 domain-containing protein [Bacillota bacterium]
MFLHLGGNCLVLAAQVITILNLKSTEDSKITAEMKELLLAEGLVEEVSPGVPKSLIITDEKAYLSPISSVTLKNRLSSYKKGTPLVSL